MPKLILTSELLGKLSGITSPVEVCDESGKVIGIFRPMVTDEMYQSRISEEELQRRETANEKRYSTAEVLSHLEKL
jgi:hypothetical protein